ncbi:MAG: ATPase, partial [Bacteroidota bacterium]
IIYKSVAFRDQMLKLPFAQGINMAHNRLQDTFNNLK